MWNPLVTIANLALTSMERRTISTFMQLRRTVKNLSDPMEDIQEWNDVMEGCFNMGYSCEQ